MIKNKIFIVLLLLLTFIFIFSILASAESKVAVMPFEKGDFSWRYFRGRYISEGITKQVTNELVGKKGIRVIERDRIDEILNEQRFQSSDMVSNAVRLGEILGVDYVILGSYQLYVEEVGSISFNEFKLEGVSSKVVLNGRLVSVETGEVLSNIKGEGVKKEIGVTIRRYEGISFGTDVYEDSILGESLDEAVSNFIDDIELESDSRAGKTYLEVVSIIDNKLIVRKKGDNVENRVNIVREEKIDGFDNPVKMTIGDARLERENDNSLIYIVLSSDKEVEEGDLIEF